MPTITIPDETYKQLKNRAAALKTTVESVVDQLIRNEPVKGNGSPLDSDEEWKRAFDALLLTARSRASRYPAGFEADISRESMYEDGPR